ncbi:MAG: hypothetical protein A2096_07455 [Spirochaetes bacterium GWF1_41_5]|nr:MAG: hypothetical protein A2096_07455 [Spirochaetes bacterium GWF1_41_5]
MNHLSLLIFIIMFSVFGFSQSQEAAKTEIEKKSEKTDTLDAKILKFGPSFEGLLFTSPQAEKDQYEKIKIMLKEIKEEYMRRMLVYIEKTAEQVNNLPGQDAASLEFINYFDTVSARVRNIVYVQEAVNFLNLAVDQLGKIKSALEANKDIDKNDLTVTEKDLYKCRAIFSMFRGNPENLMQAHKDFNFIINSKLSADENETIEIYTHLAGINNRLANINKENITIKRQSLQNVLLYLWKIIELRNKANEELKEFKLKELLKNYYFVVDFNGQDYRDLYRPYMQKIGMDYKGPEAKAGDAPAAAETKPAAGSSEAKPAAQ